MGEKLGETGEELEAAGEARTRAEREKERLSSREGVSTAGGFLYPDNLFEAFFSASLSFLHLLVVEAKQDDEEDS